ncbi:hypothetical protein [Streptomyces sp. URMC 129]|uniref:hypothetical protein n=1 Tax=Streptomyces sp. URMC 129 TaxID=3423407 RepID=UPI003F19E661
MAEPRRAALCAVIGSFHDGLSEPATTVPPALPQADLLRERMVAGLSVLRYECQVLPATTAKKLDRMVEEFLDQRLPPRSTWIVHVLSRGEGETANYTDVRVLGSDGKAHRSTAVERWLKQADEDRSQGALPADGSRTPALWCRRYRGAARPPATPSSPTPRSPRWTRRPSGGYDVAQGFPIPPRRVALDSQVQVAARGRGQQVTTNLLNRLTANPSTPSSPPSAPASPTRCPTASTRRGGWRWTRLHRPRVRLGPDAADADRPVQRPRPAAARPVGVEHASTIDGYLRLRDRTRSSQNPARAAPQAWGKLRRGRAANTPVGRAVRGVAQLIHAASRHHGEGRAALPGPA